MSITLVIVGNTQHNLMKFAVEKTKNCVPIDKIKVFSDIDPKIEGSEFIPLPERFGLYEYSLFMIKELVKYIDTDHVLICQYDGFGVNKEFWNDKYLQYDYIGSATYYKHAPLFKTLTECKIVENMTDEWYSLGGGFCLRSKKLLEALSDPKIEPSFFNYSVNAGWSCEDISIGIIYKNYLEENYGIKFGSMEDSIEFAAEILSGYNFCLGFHGWVHVPLFLSEQETLYYIKEYINYNGTSKVNMHNLMKFVGACYDQNYFSVISFLKRLYNFI